MLSVYSSSGFWLAGLMALSQLVNGVRALVNPLGFAEYMGLPLIHAEDVGFVQVYGFRALFVGVLVGMFLVRKDLRSLLWVAIAALVMPLGDIWLVTSADAEAAIVARHVLIALVVAATALLLFLRLRREAQLHG